MSTACGRRFFVARTDPIPGLAPAPVECLPGLDQFDLLETILDQDRALQALKNFRGSPSPQLSLTATQLLSFGFRLRGSG
jgi:hypothetical protein